MMLEFLRGFFIAVGQLEAALKMRDGHDDAYRLMEL
jgi:hypothetical protein